MSSVSAAKSVTNALSAAIVASDKLPRTKVWGETDSAVSWQDAFAVMAGTARPPIHRRLRGRAVKAARLAHRRNGRDAVHHRGKRQALSRNLNHAPRSAPAACSC